MSTITLKIEFGGGLELLFGNQKSHKVTLPARVPSAGSGSGFAGTPTNPLASNDAIDVPVGFLKPVDVTYLMHHLRIHLLTEREELFMSGDTVRPGILVLINDTDWELEGEGEYQLEDGNEIVFISVLHGG